MLGRRRRKPPQLAPQPQSSPVPAPPPENPWQPEDTWKIDRYLADVQSSHDERMRTPQYVPPPRLRPEPYADAGVPARAVVDAFIRMLLFFRAYRGEDDQGPAVATAYSVLPVANAGDCLGRFVYAIWPHLDPDSREVLLCMPSAWAQIEQRWMEMALGERERVWGYYMQIMPVYEQLLTRSSGVA